ncbi:hypothetical protein AC622_14990 [Bacillus sp. FJAT-27916]|uniref:prolyl oligopeptidase family serine peptidase n=1 Tax=Bacillus sp. FJAT-27916 TaxID=1679169 RepID=UPI0006714107|nr:prolyl oligopeptidase family serine peptidase [Bacillus sp. FJAT-27916]KMY45367.1 hypothetical protein AC622_14990 [Bacillus sp. FJAT-27916]
MIQIEKVTVEDVPMLIIGKQDLKNIPLPGFIFLHGFMSAKEHNLHYAYLLAERGFRVFLPDAIMHGERGGDYSEEVMSKSFWKIILSSIKELPKIKHYITEYGYVIHDRIALGGTSMGAITTFGALTQYEWIKAAVSMMGTPAYQDFTHGMLKQGLEGISEAEVKETLDALTKYDLSLQPEKLNGRPLFIWHGEKDPVVPIAGIRTFLESQARHFKDEQVTYVTDEQAGHAVTRKGLLEAVNWIEEKVI